MTTRARPRATQVERRPVGELGVRLVDHDQAGRHVEHGVEHVAGDSTRPVGLFGEHRNVTAGWASRRPRRDLAEVEREVVAARSPSTTVAPGDPGDVGVQLVRRLERDTVRPGAGVGEQQRLQHLVRSVGGEDLLGVDAVPARRSPPAARGRRGRGSGATSTPASSAANASRHASRRRERRLVGVQPDVDVDLRRVVALEGAQVVANADQLRGRLAGRRRRRLHAWRR